MAPSSNIVDHLTQELFRGENVTVQPGPDKDSAYVQIAVHKSVADIYAREQEAEKNATFHLLDFMKTHRQLLISFEVYDSCMEEFCGRKNTHGSKIYENSVQSGFVDKETGTVSLIWCGDDGNFYTSEIPIAKIIEFKDRGISLGPNTDILMVETFLENLLKEIGFEPVLSYKRKDFEDDREKIRGFLALRQQKEGVKKM